MKPALLVLLTLTMLGCQKNAVSHPGAISSFDSWSYDVLLTEQAVINQARADYLAGKLPPQAKEPLNIAIRQFNVAQAGWKAYHESGGDAPALQQTLNGLIAAVAQLQKVLGQKAEPAAPITFVRPVWRFA